jgi:hypothetical protein
MKRLKSSSIPLLTHVLAPNVIHVATVSAATVSLVTHVAAAEKPSVPVIHVATVSVATGSLVTHVTATAKPFVDANS